MSTTPSVRSWSARATVGAALACALWVSPFVAAGAAGSQSPSPTTSAAPASFGLRPATALGPDSRTSLTYDLTPGQVISDHIALTNDSPFPLVVRLFATDATTTTEGGFVLLPSSETPVDVGTWVRLESAESVTVPARASGSSGPATMIVPIRVTVPEDAAPGDHAGGVIAAVMTTSTDSRGQPAALERRVVTRLLIRVAGATRPELAIDHLRVEYAGSVNSLGTGVATVSYTVHNTGNITVGGQQSISIAGLWGPTALLNAPGLSPMVPGGSLKVVVVVPDAPQGLSDTVTVTVLPRDVRPGAGSGAAVAAVAATTVLAVPWTALVGVALLVVIAVAILRWRRRARPVPPPVTKTGTARAARHSRP